MSSMDALHRRMYSIEVVASIPANVVREDEEVACEALRKKAIEALAIALTTKLKDVLYSEFEFTYDTDELNLKLRLDVVKPR